MSAAECFLADGFRVFLGGRGGVTKVERAAAAAAHVLTVWRYGYMYVSTR